MENKYVTVKESKFTKETIAESFEHNYSLTETNAGLNENAIFQFRYVSSGTGDNELSIVVTFSSFIKEKKNTYIGKEAMLSEGNIILNLNHSENISVNANNLIKNKTKVKFEGTERVKYCINKEILYKICDADSLEIQMSGNEKSWDLDGSVIIFMARTFCSALYNEAKYLDQIKKQTEIDEKKRRIDKIGGRIALFLFVAGIVVCVSFCSKIDTYLTIDSALHTFKESGNDVYYAYAHGTGYDLNYKSGEVPFYLAVFFILSSIVAWIITGIVSRRVKNTYGN